MSCYGQNLLDKKHFHTSNKICKNRFVARPPTNILLLLFLFFFFCFIYKLFFLYNFFLFLVNGQNPLNKKDFHTTSKICLRHRVARLLTNILLFLFLFFFFCFITNQFFVIAFFICVRFSRKFIDVCSA